MSPSPSALLLDFGGVIADSTPSPNWEKQLAREVQRTVPEASELSLDQITADIIRGGERNSRWKDSASDNPEPQELTAHTFWLDFVARLWPEHARQALKQHAKNLCAAMVDLSERRSLRSGITHVFEQASAQNIPIAIVSNTLSGTVYRNLVSKWGLTPTASIYSDEVGIRKPHPGMIELACQTLDTTCAEAWFVGDTFDRDVLCGVRAGVAHNILLRSTRTQDADVHIAAPTHRLNQASELVELLQTHGRAPK